MTIRTRISYFVILIVVALVCLIGWRSIIVRKVRPTSTLGILVSSADRPVGAGSPAASNASPVGAPRGSGSGTVKLPLSCVHINNEDYSGQVILPSSSWVELNRGNDHNGFSFSSDGGLFYKGNMLTNNIPVSASDNNDWIYARSIAISPISPSGRSAILQACEQPRLKGMCWALFVLDLGSHHMERTSAGKYGAERQVFWIQAKDEYGVLHDTEEGQTNWYRIHLATGTSTECGVGGR
jgi:hypothetical protein